MKDYYLEILRISSKQETVAEILEELENLLTYCYYHNKNLTACQEAMIDDLRDMLDKLL